MQLWEPVQPCQRQQLRERVMGAHAPVCHEVICTVSLEHELRSWGMTVPYPFVIAKRRPTQHAPHSMLLHQGSRLGRCGSVP
jgi:hypothetical protein